MKYIVLYRPDALVSNFLFSDLKRLPCVKFVPIYKKINRFYRNFVTLYTCGNWFSNLFLFFKPFSLFNYSLRKTDLSSDTTIITFNSMFSMLSSSYLRKLKASGAKLVLVAIDSFNLVSNYEKPKFEFFSDIYTFDPSDAKIYGFKLIQSYYSKLDIKTKAKQRCGVYFCGTMKDKLERLHEAYAHLTGNSVYCDFNILYVPQKAQCFSGIKYLDSKIPYSEYLNEMNTLSCIFDITQKNQTGITIRYYEAVCYNKKLITDNPLVKKMPFYNPDYIQIYDKIENIDTDWIKRDIKVDYGYDGRFSPVNFLNELKV